MARAFGSYPTGRWFKSDFRYQLLLQQITSFLRRARPVGQAVKTRPFHGCNMGSIPVRVTKNPSDKCLRDFSFCWHKRPVAAGNRKAAKPPKEAAVGGAKSRGAAKKAHGVCRPGRDTAARRKKDLSLFVRSCCLCAVNRGLENLETSCKETILFFSLVRKEPKVPEGLRPSRLPGDDSNLRSIRDCCEKQPAFIR